jgi:hypothetical protein
MIAARPEMVRFSGGLCLMSEDPNLEAADADVDAEAEGAQAEEEV